MLRLYKEQSIPGAQKGLVALVTLLVLIAAAFTLAACGAKEGPVPDELANYQTSDMSGYNCSQGYEGEYRFVDMTVKDIAAEMDEGSTFAVFAGFANCPWCNVMLNPLNDVATERETHVGYLDLRKNPSWENNLAIDDYDLLVERFGDALELDENDVKHLYAPHVFFIKDGKLVDHHDGTVPSQEDPDVELTEEQIQELKNAYDACFGKLL